MTPRLVSSGPRQGTAKGRKRVATERKRSAVNNYVTEGNVKGRRKKTGRRFTAVTVIKMWLTSKQMTNKNITLMPIPLIPRT
jgi:hypothetical protein